MRTEGRTLIVEEGETIRRTFPVAAWWQEIELEAGQYPIREAHIPGMVCATLPGRVVREYFPALFGGVAYANAQVKEVNRPTTYFWQSYAFRLKEAEHEDE